MAIDSKSYKLIMITIMLIIIFVTSFSFYEVKDYTPIEVNNLAYAEKMQQELVAAPVHSIIIYKDGWMLIKTNNSGNNRIRLFDRVGNYSNSASLIKGRVHSIIKPSNQEDYKRLAVAFIQGERIFPE